MTQSAYCRKWFYAGKRPVGPLSDDHARAEHEARRPYAAVIGDPAAPRSVVSFGGPWVSVSFLDEGRREYLRYDFKEVSPGRLFLTMATHRLHDGEADQANRVTRFAFDEQGRTLMERSDLASDTREEMETISDVSNNWEDYPAFGSYGGLTKEERRIAAANVAADARVPPRP